MPEYPGADGGTVPVPNTTSGLHLAKGESQYVYGVLASTATQLPVNDTNVAFEAASADAVEASMSVNLQPSETNSPPMVTVEIHTNGAPGAGESFAVQEADTDADAFYITPTNAAYTIAVGVSGFARSDLSPTGGKFMRVVRTKGANAVGCTVKLTRPA